MAKNQTSSKELVDKEGEGQIIGDRKQLENNKTPKSYLKNIQKDPAHSHEVGMTIKHFLTQCAIRLFLTNKVSYDYYDYNGVFLIGNKIIQDNISVDVPSGSWYRGSRRLGVFGSGPDDRREDCGCPSAVRVGKFEI